MVNYKQILEAVRRGIELSLDDFDDLGNGSIAPVKDTIKNNNSTKELVDEYLKELVVPQKSKNWSNTSSSENFDVNLDLKTWIQSVDIDNFYRVLEGGLTTLRRTRGKHYVDIPFSVGIYFNDGYLEIRLILNTAGPNKYIKFKFYFSDRKLGFRTIPRFDDAYLKQMQYLKDTSKPGTSMDWNWISPMDKKKEGSEKVLRYLRYYKDFILYQPCEGEKEKEGI